MQRTKLNRGGASPLLILSGLYIVSLLVWGQDVHYGHAYALVIVAFLAISLMMENLPLTLFGIYLSAWFAFMLSAACHGIIPEEIIGQAFGAIIMAVAGMCLYIWIKKSKGPLETYMNWVCVLALVLSFMGLIQVFIGKGSPVATLGNQNFLAAFIAISAVFFIRKRWWVFLPVIGLALYIAKTSTAIAAAFISCAFYFWGWKGAGLSIIPAIAYYLLFKIPVHAGSLGARLDYWTDALSKISNSWQTLVFGVGPGVYWQYGNELHSEYVYLLFNFGIIGLAIMAAYTYTSFRKPCDRRLLAAFLAIVVNAFGNHVMHTAPTAFLALIIFALKDRQEEALSCQ